jgi:hypothetical protein
VAKGPQVVYGQLVGPPVVLTVHSYGRSPYLGLPTPEPRNEVAYSNGASHEATPGSQLLRVVTTAGPRRYIRANGVELNVCHIEVLLTVRRWSLSVRSLSVSTPVAVHKSTVTCGLRYVRFVRPTGEGGTRKLRCRDTDATGWARVKTRAV